ncbi:FCD domain-containing protein, partial [Neobacillus niacini]|uniref:FadR/GntR family transcriptional regulator n=1 Tax=Neobacillus niacini TaxID=86668 RepID=UPI003001401F
MEVRHALERQAASLACLRRTEVDLKQMDFFGNKCQQFYDENDTENFVKADWSLHQSVVSASNNQLLIEMHTGLYEEIQLSISHTTGIEDDYDPGHQKLIQAIRAQDTDGAVQAVDDYIQHFKKFIIPRANEFEGL